MALDLDTYKKLDNKKAKSINDLAFLLVHVNHTFYTRLSSLF